MLSDSTGPQNQGRLLKRQSIKRYASADELESAVEGVTNPTKRGEQLSAMWVGCACVQGADTEAT